MSENVNTLVNKLVGNEGQVTMAARGKLKCRLPFASLTLVLSVKS